MKSFINLVPAFIQKGILIAFTCLYLTSSAYCQIPPNVEESMDAFYMGLLEVYKVIKEENEETALSKIEEMRPGLIENAKAYADAAEELEELRQDIPENEFEQLFQNKTYFQEMMALMSDEEFMTKYKSSPELQQRMEEIVNLINMNFGGEEDDAEMYEDDFGYGFEYNDEVFTIEIGDNNNYSSSYTVMSNFEGGAIAYSQDDEDFSSVEIMGEVNGGEAMVTFFVYNTGPGKQEWSTDGHFVLEFVNEEGEVNVSLWGSEEMGYIQIQEFGDINEFITGSIVGECSDMAGDSDDVIPIKAKFQVRRIEMDY